MPVSNVRNGSGLAGGRKRKPPLGCAPVHLDRRQPRMTGRRGFLSSRRNQRTAANKVDRSVGEKIATDWIGPEAAI